MSPREHPAGPAPKRNDPCPCGSGRKYKQCCQTKDLAVREDGFGQVQLRTGLAAERQGRFNDAISAYRAAAFGETAAEANSRLGHVLLSLGRPNEAAGALRAAAEASPQSTERRLDLVRALMIEKQDADAEAEARRALEGDPRSADGYWLLGRIEAEGGRFEEARASFERSLALKPRQGAVYLDLVRTYRQGEADRSLVSRMLALARSDGDTDQRIRLNFAIGKALDDLGEYGRAMRHFAKASELKASIAAFDRAAVERTVDGLIERFTPDFLSAHPVGSDERRPVFVVGMPRSGTTLVEQILSSHPQIAGAGELQFWTLRGPLFDRLTGPAQTSPFVRQAAEDCLQALSDLAPGAARVVDKNPFNFLWAGLIRMAFPRAPIIHCRRDPLDTCLSIHTTYFAPRADFSTGLDDLAFYYRQYRRLMDHWREVLDEDSFVEVDYEALVADPEPHSRRLIAACGVAWDEACLRPELNGRVVRTASKWQARQPITTASVSRWRRYEPWLGPLKGLAASGSPNV